MFEEGAVMYGQPLGYATATPGAPLLYPAPRRRAQ